METIRIALILLFISVALVSCTSVEMLPDEEPQAARPGVPGPAPFIMMAFPHYETVFSMPGMPPEQPAGLDMSWFSRCSGYFDMTSGMRRDLLLKEYDYYEAVRRGRLAMARLGMLQADIETLMRQIDVATPVQCR